MKKLWLPVFLVSTLPFTFFACSEIDENEKIAKPKFHSSADEGIWVGKSDTHMPQITFTGNNEIDVFVPLKPVKNPIHYIEVIVLMDGTKEIASQKFSFSLEPARAHFTLPNPEKGNYKVVVKCNMHDMWMAPVVLPSRGGK